MLQWGHADGGVEGMTNLSTTSAPTLLQWGHADGGVEGSRQW